MLPDGRKFRPFFIGSNACLALMQAVQGRLIFGPFFFVEPPEHFV